MDLDVSNDARILLEGIPSRPGARCSGDDTEALRSDAVGAFDGCQHAMSASATREGKESKKGGEGRVEVHGLIRMCKNVNARKGD